MWLNLPAMQPCLCAASPSPELCLFLHSPIRRGGENKPPPAPSPFFTSLWERGHGFPGEADSSIWTLSSLSLELCVPVTGADLSHIFHFLYFVWDICTQARCLHVQGKGCSGAAAEMQVRPSPIDGVVRGSARGKLRDLTPLFLFLLALLLHEKNLILSTCFSWEKTTLSKPKTSSVALRSVSCSRSWDFLIFFFFFGGFSFVFWFLNFFHPKFYILSLEEGH